MTQVEMQNLQAQGPEVGRVETDTFCGECGYNLHALPVVRDERLGIAVVRCPECGKFQAAGVATGAGRVWLTRLAGMLITLWVIFIIGSVFAWGLGMLLSDIVDLDAFTRHEFVRLPGGGSTYIVRPMTISDFGSIYTWLFARGTMTFVSMSLGYCLGGFLVVFLWHVKKYWH